VTTTASAVAKVAVTYVPSGGASVSNPVTTTSTGGVDTNGVMTFDGTYYHYNLATKGFSVTAFRLFTRRTSRWPTSPHRALRWAQM